jgi:hypothetical protein
MLKKLSFFVFILLALPTLVFSQNNKQVMKKAPIILNEPSNVSGIPAYTSFGAGTLQSPTVATWVTVDTMSNAFGPAIGVLNPVAYDPSANVVAVVHRGKTPYAAGSGELWYNISTDKGVTWTRVPAGINTANSQIQARYPSMAISNPTGGGLSATTGVFSWPELGAGAFGWVGYGADQPVGAATTFSGIDEGPPLYSSQVACWASANSSWMFWESDNQTDASIDLWRTQDFGTITKTTPPAWSDTAFGSSGNICLGGASFNGVDYVGFLGTLNNSTPITSGWFPGYSKSTDNGATWSVISIADFRTIPSISRFDRIYDYKKGDTFVSYTGDINVDANGRVHLLVPLTDTTTDNNTGKNAIVDIFETATGWDGSVVYEGLNDTAYLTGPGLAQVGPGCYLAFNKDRNVMAVQWINSPSNSKFADVFFSYKKLSDAQWSAPINLTESPNINNTCSHLAPMLYQSGNNLTAFSMDIYGVGATGPYYDSTTATAIYMAAVPFNVTVGVEDEISSVNNFELAQNYPNPFNPSTSIKYTISERANVSLKVFDVLGREVAGLVNTTKEAGSYEITFDASNLSSGLYIYTINAGNFSASKKMMLMK